MQLEEWLRRGRLKPTRRAVEKAAACYGGDVSLVTDVCRGRLVFGSVPALAHGLALVAGCPAARVLRVDNGLLPGRESERSAGFRVM